MRIQNTPSGSNPFKRGIAIITAVLFLFTQLYSYAPSAFAQSINSKVQGGNPSKDLSRPIRDAKIRIPPELGLITESFHGTSGRTILFIQDAHDSLEAQENIAKIINHLVSDYGVQTVFEEGYEGPVPTDKYFGFIKDPKIKEKVAYFLMDHLRVGGAEYAHINRTKDFNLIGADSLKLHKENIDQYRFSATKKDAITKDLKSLEKELKSLVDSRFPKELKEWLKTKRQFDAKTLDLFTYLGRTMPLLGEHGAEKSLGLIGFLIEAMKTNDPAVIEKAKHIDAREVFGELIKLEQAISETYLHDTADKQLFDYYKILSLFNRLNALQVSQEEYEAAKASLEAFDTDSFGRFIFSQTPKTLILSRMWERNIKDAVRFYEIAQERDHSLSQMLDGYSEGKNKKEELVQKPDVSVLVFGGFHKEAIKRILQAKGISYLIVSPHITRPSPRHEGFYKRLMADGHLSYELPVNLHTASRPWTQLEIWNGNQTLARSELRIMASVAENMPNVDISSLILSMEQALKNSTTPTRSEVRRKISLLLAEAGVQKLSGKKQTEVAEIIGASRAGVSHYLDQHPEAYDTYKILRPVDIETGLAEAGVQKLSGKNHTEVAEIIGASRAGVSHYLDQHPEAYDTYKILRPVDIETGLAEAGVQKLSGKKQTEVAEIIGASRAGVSHYLDQHPEAYDTYKILRPVDIETGLAEAGVQKLSGKKQTEVAEIIGASRAGVSHYLDQHPEAYDTYKILRPVDIETGLAEAGVQKLSGKNHTEVAEIIGASRAGVSHYLDQHPEAYDTYIILRPVDIETGLAEAGVQKLSGKNHTEVAEIIGASRAGVSHYLDQHPEAYDTYKILRPVDIETGLAEAGVQKLSGKNHTEVAEIIGASRAGVSHYLDQHPEAYDTYIILRPVDIETGLAEAGVQKLSGKNHTEVAEIIGASRAGVSHYLDQHPEAYSVYQIRKPRSVRSEVREAMAVELSQANIPTPTTPEIRSMGRMSNMPTFRPWQILHLKQDVIVVVEQAKIDMLSPEMFKELLEIAGLNIGKLHLVIPDALQGKYSQRVAELRKVATVYYGFPQIAVSDKIPVIGFSDMEHDGYTLADFKKGIDSRLAERMKDSAFGLNRPGSFGVGILYALKDIPPDRLPPNRNGFRYDPSGWYSAQVLEVLQAYTVISTSA